jgi:hypothetical protein
MDALPLKGKTLVLESRPHSTANWQRRGVREIDTLHRRVNALRHEITTGGYPKARITDAHSPNGVLAAIIFEKLDTPKGKLP